MSRFEIIGMTEDNQVIVSGLYRASKEEGHPISAMLTSMCREGFWPDWASEVAEMRSNGMTATAIMNVVMDAVYASEWSTEEADGFVGHVAQLLNT